VWWQVLLWARRLRPFRTPCALLLGWLDKGSVKFKLTKVSSGRKVVKQVDAAGGGKRLKR